MRERNPVGVARFRATCCVGLVNTDPTPPDFEALGASPSSDLCSQIGMRLSFPTPGSFRIISQEETAMPLVWTASLAPSSGAFAIVLKRSGCRG